MKIAIIGQSLFASSVYNLLKDSGHEIVGVFTIPDDAKGREDPLALTANADSVPVFKFKRWRIKGEIIPSVFESYKAIGAELNVLPYCSQFIPMEVINYPVHKSIVYHPSLLPKHRGAASINWTLIEGDKKGGFTIFWADDGLDTGPILLQKEVLIDQNDTIETLYNRFLYPEGVEGIGEAVDLIAEGIAPRIIQTEVGASYEPMLNTKESSKINFEKLTAIQLHNFIRGCDKVPGAWCIIEEQTVKVHGSRIWNHPIPTESTPVKVDGMATDGLVHSEGILLFGNDAKAVNVAKLSLESGKMINAAKFGKQDTAEGKDLVGTLTSDEEKIIEDIRSIWNLILRVPVEASTDFFAAGASSMDVTRMIDQVREDFEVTELESGHIYADSIFEDFIATVVLLRRGVSSKLDFEAKWIQANNRDISFPTQLFIDNKFVNSSNGKTLKIINPNDESIICEVQAASAHDVDLAVAAAHRAFEGEWGNMNARERGRIIYKLADLMEAHKEELATIESIDSGAVYSLALKTHVGMSIETWRYFAGWCDKIHGKTIPINNARPNKNLCLTRRTPIGVCGLITPWNYPLMMLSWKMAACLAAGNTVLIKPAQVSPLTALKFAELSARAGFPPGVINVLPGTGGTVGVAISEHPLVRKVGFTGSTPIGKIIMGSCAGSNVKKVSLELGGKSPLIIFADCDLDKAVRNAMSSVFFNKGENCIAAGRLFVEEAILRKFVRRVVSETKKMVIGDPLDRKTMHGPQNHLAHLEKLVEYCEIGVKEGAKLLWGGKREDRPGLYFTPTIFTDVEDHMYIAIEESFGPIMIISSFPNGDIDGVLKRVNATEFGLASGVFTKDINKALRISEKIEAGTCFINCYNKTDVAAPFGGFKQSGFGKDLGEEALNEYLHTKTITVEY